MQINKMPKTIENDNSAKERVWAHAMVAFDA
jgi:hypothetical protein